MRSVSVPWVADVAAGNLGSLSPPVHVIRDLPVKHQTTTPEHVILGQRELTRGRDATVMRGFLAAIPTTPTRYPLIKDLYISMNAKCTTITDEAWLARSVAG